MKPPKENHVKIRAVGEKNNDKFRESKKEIYLRIEREKKFWWRVWYKLMGK